MKKSSIVSRKFLGVACMTESGPVAAEIPSVASDELQVNVLAVKNGGRRKKAPNLQPSVGYASVMLLCLYNIYKSVKSLVSRKKFGRVWVAFGLSLVAVLSFPRETKQLVSSYVPWVKTGLIKTAQMGLTRINRFLAAQFEREIPFGPTPQPKIVFPLNDAQAQVNT